jgi:uncharacterized membrane protein
MTGLGLGAGLMYVLDPDRGRRRRAIARDKMVRQLHRTGNGMEIAARDLAHRAQGVAARTKRKVFERPVDDAVLVARVRARLGRLVSHPHAIEVTSDQQGVTLRGLILSDEVDRLMEGLKDVPGIKECRNQLKVYERDEKIPSLQGGKQRTEAAQYLWTPATRWLTGSAALLPVVFGARRRDLPGYMLSGLGLGLLIRAISNESVKQFLGIGPAAMISVHKTIRIAALPEDVFNFWSDFNNFPQFLPDVIEVRDLGQNRSRWSVAGPGGVPIHWNAVTTRYEPNEFIAWRSEQGSIVKNAGCIRFLAEADGGTRIEMELSYRPPVGRLGHAVAKLFGTDPKSRIDDAFVRVKSLLERGYSETFGSVAV